MQLSQLNSIVQAPAYTPPACSRALARLTITKSQLRWTLPVQIAQTSSHFFTRHHHHSSSDPIKSQTQHCSGRPGVLFCRHLCLVRRRIFILNQFTGLNRPTVCNRVHSSAALQTHSLWQSAIGYDPYAPTGFSAPLASQSYRKLSRICCRHLFISHLSHGC